jgi:hypothetical protein
MSITYAVFIVSLILAVGASASTKIGAQLEAVTIRDMYVGFCMSGQIARVGLDKVTEEDVKSAHKVADLLMRKRK